MKVALASRSNIDNSTAENHFDRQLRASFVEPHTSQVDDEEGDAVREQEGDEEQVQHALRLLCLKHFNSSSTS